MKLIIDPKDTIALTQALFNELQTMRRLEADGCDEYQIVITLVKFLLTTKSITIEDNLPF